MRLTVEMYDPTFDDWRECGSVLLPAEPSRIEMEGALSALGLYCPRGADTVRFSYWWQADEPFAIIDDAEGRPMVRLWRLEKLAASGGHG